MTKNKKKTEFEVLSECNDDKEFDEDESSELNDKELDEDESESSNEDNIFKDYNSDHSNFFHELYKDNRELHKTITEKEQRIARLEERHEFLVNSNLFWMCSTACSMMAGFFSLLKQ